MIRRFFTLFVVPFETAAGVVVVEEEDEEICAVEMRPLVLDDEQDEVGL